jgi:hypothetical protein
MTLGAKDVVECCMRRFVPNAVAALMGAYCAKHGVSGRVTMQPIPARLYERAFGANRAQGFVTGLLAGHDRHLLLISEQLAWIGASQMILCLNDQMQLVGQRETDPNIDLVDWWDGVAGLRSAWIFGRTSRPAPSHALCALDLSTYAPRRTVEFHDSRVRAIAAAEHRDGSAMLYLCCSDFHGVWGVEVGNLVCLDGYSLTPQWTVPLPSAFQGVANMASVRSAIIGEWLYLVFELLERKLNGSRGGISYRWPRGVFDLPGPSATH